MMAQRSPIQQEDAEIANAMRKLRLLSKMTMSSYSKMLGTTEETLGQVENLEITAPMSLVKRAAAEAGLTPEDLTNGRLAKIFDETSLDITKFLSKTLPNSELFDLINYYSLLREELHRTNMRLIMKTLSCEVPLAGRILHLVKDTKS